MINKVILDQDFSKARSHARLEDLFATFRWKSPELLSFYEVTSLIRPEAQSYLGVHPIEVKKIVGSENRYHDFSATFHPRVNNLKQRWESIDGAMLEDVYLPPISVYKISDCYFVRDGNHRVSVAASQGQVFIDAEVVELRTGVDFHEGMTIPELKKAVVAYERKAFISQYNPTFLPMDEIVFTAPGSYPEMVHHILVHKYYANQDSPVEMTFQDGAESWYRNVYFPIVDAAREEKLLSLNPGTTEGDLYMWLVRRWDELKRTHALATMKEAALDYRRTNQKGILAQLKGLLKKD